MKGYEGEGDKMRIKGFQLKHFGKGEGKGKKKKARKKEVTFFP